MLGAGDAAVSLNRHQAAGLSPVIVVGKSAALAMNFPESVRKVVVARMQILDGYLFFIWDNWERNSELRSRKDHFMALERTYRCRHYTTYCRECHRKNLTNSNSGSD